MTSPSSPQTEGAGQQAALDNGLLLRELFSEWGTVRHPGEPMSVARANVEQSIDALTTLLKTLVKFETGDALYTLVETDLDRAWEYLIDIIPLDHEGPHSQAQSADEYIELMLTPLPVGAGKRIDFAELKRRIDIVEYAGRHTTLRKSGTTFKGSCPLPNHEDSTPSFWVYAHNQSWYCFGCAKGGDVIDLAKALGQRIT